MKMTTTTTTTTNILNICLLFLGCSINGITMELILQYHTGCGIILTFMQTLFITLMSIHLKKPSTPLWFYLMLTFIFWCVGLLNNIAFDYHITQPIHMIVRSSSLAASYIVGYLFFNQFIGNNRWRFLSIVIITLGIIITISSEFQLKTLQFTTCSADGLSRCSSSNEGEDVMMSSSSNKSELMLEWYIGVTILIITLCLSALLGHLQQWGYRKWGKDVQEGQFYTHFISLFYFIFLHNELKNQAIILSGIPNIWLWVVVNLISQYICVRSVYNLIGSIGALTMTLFLTLRKFCSLFFSIWYFNNVFYLNHWIGCLMVFIGCFLYN